MPSSHQLICVIVLLHFAASIATVSSSALRSAQQTDSSTDSSCNDELPPDDDQSSEISPVPQEDVSCTDCANRNENLTEDEVNQLRIEYAKQQILEKLHMTKPPCRSHPKPPLLPLLEAADMLDNKRESEEEESGDVEFGSRVKSIVLYPVPGNTACITESDVACNRFRFQYRKDTSPGSSSMAELWLYKQNVQDVLKITQLIFRESGRIRKREIVHQNVVHTARLVKFRLPASTTWIESGENRILTIEVSCISGCESTPPVSDIGEEQPFLVVNFNSNRSVSRSRRSIDCVEGSSLCCRKSLNLTFHEVGWDWIIAPTVYEVNFCWGKCFTADTNTKFHHTTMLNSFINRNRTAVQQLGLSMCCTPSKMSSLNILYLDDNGHVVKAELQGMKVEACKCA